MKVFFTVCKFVLPPSSSLLTDLFIYAPILYFLGEIFEMDTDDAKSSGVLPQKTQTDILEGDKLEYRNSLFGKSTFN